MKETHTPAPWVLDDSSHNPIDGEPLIAEDYHFIDAGEGVTPNGFGISGFLSVQDARLIAAAPELLEALETVMEWVRHWGPKFIYDDSWHDDKAKIEAVIAKATGEQHERA